MGELLPDLEIRPIRADDKANLAAGMSALSDESRALRFFTYKERLSGRELRYLTEVDGQDHVALVALDRAAGRRGVGVARFIRLGASSEVAEAAVVVIDEYQGRGVGRRLLEALAALAVERGVRWFRCEVLPQNSAMRALIDAISPEVRSSYEDGVLIMDVPLTAEARDEARDESAIEEPAIGPAPLSRLVAALEAGHVVLEQVRGRVQLRGALKRR